MKRLTTKIPPPEKPFEVVCTNCVHECMRKMIPYEGKVNHNYRIFSQTYMRIEYRCFNCGTEYNLEVDSLLNPNQQEPKNKEDFERKVGYKEEVSKN